jgi:hypothetical protein
VGFTGVFLLSNPFAKLILILISRDENHSKFNNFRTIGPKLVKQQTRMLPCQGLPLVPKVEQGGGPYGFRGSLFLGGIYLLSFEKGFFFLNF